MHDTSEPCLTAFIPSYTPLRAVTCYTTVRTSCTDNGPSRVSRKIDSRSRFIDSTSYSCNFPCPQRSRTVEDRNTATQNPRCAVPPGGAQGRPRRRPFSSLGPPGWWRESSLAAPHGPSPLESYNGDVCTRHDGLDRSACGWVEALRGAQSPSSPPGRPGARVLPPYACSMKSGRAGGLQGGHGPDHSGRP